VLAQCQSSHVYLSNDPLVTIIKQYFIHNVLAHCHSSHVYLSNYLLVTNIKP